MVVLSFAFAAVAAFVICLAAGPLARALGVMDIPDGDRKLHSAPTPEVGGVAVGLPLLVVLGSLAVVTQFTPLYGVLTAAIAASLVLGFIDDRRHVRPAVRLLLSVTVALAVLYFVPAERVSFFHFTFLDVAVFPSTWVAVTFTVLCIVGLQNALNMADGKNGLAVGLLLIWSALMLGYAPAHVVPALSALIGALAVVFVFNARGRLFLGDAGTYGLSVAVAFLALHVYGTEFVTLSADIVALWFLIPVADALRLMVTRSLTGRSPFSADRRHFHHILQVAFPTWQPGARLSLYLGLVAVPGALAIPYPELTLLWSLLAVGAYGSVLMIARLPVAPTVRLPSPNPQA